MRLFQRKPKRPLLPLRSLVVMPHTQAEVDVGRAGSKLAIERALSAEGQIFLATQKHPEVDFPGLDDLYPMGVLAEVRRVNRLPDGTFQVVVEAMGRARLLGLSGQDLLWAEYEDVPEPEIKDPELVRALLEKVRRAFGQYVASHKSLRLDRYQLEAIQGLADPARLADMVTHHATWTTEEKLTILSEVAIEARLERVLTLLARDLERFDLDRKIAARVKEQMDKNQREYYLREQMKAIQKELGGGEDHLAEVEALRERIQKKDFPDEVREKAERELDRYQRMQPGSPEASVVRTYLEWLLDLPWREATEDVIDLPRTRKILDEDHYGLDEVKERILEFLAVRKLAGDEGAKGPILCLVGPPGVGKTSLGRSVARSMQRNFVRISLGGVRDEAEIRGHRRTYVGALPGKIIQGMKRAGSNNPVFLLDEVDKLASDWRGDPASALLEVLDPEQNKAFQDHYLEVPYDLSRVFFIVTANTLSTIPRPLLDRMEVIEIPGYTPLEKVKIARHFLWPKVSRRAGVEGRVQLEETALRRMVDEYTREAGVRGLERQLAKVARKFARKYLEAPWEGVYDVKPGDLESLLGAPKYRPDRVEKDPQVGVAQGLAWTGDGGALLTIEVLAVPGKGRLKLTGNLGSVMKESAEAALTYLRARADRYDLPPDFHEKWDLHVHIPEGAVPKDGPSAGVTLAVAIASALSGRPVRMDLAMSGEITLRGKVLPVGGIKEKLLAAFLSGVSRVLLPKENGPDLAELPPEVREGLEIVLVEDVTEVLDAALLPLAPEVRDARPAWRAGA